MAAVSATKNYQEFLLSYSDQLSSIPKIYWNALYKKLKNEVSSNQNIKFSFLAWVI